jgi:hypothetical protein
MTEINKKRILNLADFVEKLPRNRFGFASWVGHNWGGKPDLSCGTTACALGWATTMPEFSRLGLRLSKQIGVYLLNQPHEEADYRLPYIQAADKIFGLAENEAELLFVPGPETDDYDEEIYYNDNDTKGETQLSEAATPQQWAKHARAFVANL